MSGSRRASVISSMGADEIAELFEKLFDNLNQFKFTEAREFISKSAKKLPRECRNWITDLIKVEELYCTELDKVLIPASSSVFKFNRRKSAEEQYLACQKDFKTQPELEFIVDYCDCRIQLIKLFVQLYHNVGRPDVGFSTDFINIYQLFHKGEGEESDEIETKKETLHKLCTKHAADHPKVFVCLMLETELIDHILKAAKDISSLHIIPAQVALKQAEFKLNKWKDLHPVTSNQQPGMFFGMHKSNRFICSWLGELHQHLLAKFCLFFYSAFKDQKKHNSVREQEFSNLARKTKFDFKTYCIDFIEKQDAKAVYFVRDHNHNRLKYSSHCRYVFLPFVKDVIEEDAMRDPIGIVSQFSIEDKDDLNNDRRDLDFENMKKAHADYLKMLQSGNHGSREKINKKEKLSYEEAEDKIVKYETRPKSKNQEKCQTYHLGLVEATYFIVIAFDRQQEIDETTKTLFTEFRKNIRLKQTFKKLVRD